MYKILYNHHTYLKVYLSEIPSPPYSEILYEPWRERYTVVDHELLHCSTTLTESTQFQCYGII